MSAESSPILNVAVVTGRHPHEVRSFQHAISSIADAECYIQHMEDWIHTPKEERESYETVVFYNMHMDLPTENAHWCDRPLKQALEQLGDTKQGIFLLHHAILAFPKWSLWSKIVGIDDRRFEYYPDQTVKIEIVDPQHPITAGLQSWEMIDETYKINEPENGSQLLLSTNHIKSSNAIAWTRTYRNSRVFCFQSGHDHNAYENENFRLILARGIRWCAQKI